MVSDIVDKAQELANQAQDLADSTVTYATEYEKLKHMKASPASRTASRAKTITATLSKENALAIWEIFQQYEIIKMVAKGKHKKSETVESNNVSKLLNDILEAIDHEDAGLYECSGKGTVYIPRG